MHGPEDDNGCEFAGQATQVLDVVAAVAIEYLPGSQSVQLLFPLILYLPDAQAKHGPPSGPKNPALQMQLVNAEDALGDPLFSGQSKHALLSPAPSNVEYVLTLQFTQVLDAVTFSECVPATQLMHVALSPYSLYFPLAHAVHTPPFDFSNPLIQKQLIASSEPTAEIEFSGHVRHTPLVVAPVAAEYVFAPQFTQAALLVALVLVENVPARQSMHPDPAVEYLPAAHTPHAARLLAPAAAPVPAAQAAHAPALVAFVVVENVPARQSRHPEPTVENFPTPHTPHAALEPAPAAAPVPAEQLRHTTLLVAPGVVENVPARQSRHPEPAVANFPAAHAPHAALEPAPARAPVPAAQSRHAPLLVVPVVFEYLPATQFSQVLALAAEYFPVLQFEQELSPVTRVPSQAYIIFFAILNSGLRSFCQPGK
jgi:hypothetical protein